MATLVTNDGREFSVDQTFVDACSTIKMFMEDVEGPVPLPNVDAATLETILKGAVPDFDDPREIFPLMNALDFLGHEALLDECARRVAESIRGMRADEIRTIFGLEKPAPKLQMTIYVIRDVKSDCNLVYVGTREEAISICAGMPSVFTWEPLELYRDGG